MSVQKPRYQQLKDDIIERISTGEFRPGDRVPSEYELVATADVSRMTANRALRELTDEGYVERVAGRGTFVAELRAMSHVREVQNIADEIAARGHRHSCDIVTARQVPAKGEVARALDTPDGEPVAHLLLVHAENGIPVQLEDRYVLESFAPDCLGQDFSSTTPSAYLTSIAPLQQAEQLVRATQPDAATRSLLGMADDEPALLVVRRTWVGGRPVTYARLHHPGSRYELAGHYQPDGSQDGTTDDVVQLEALQP